MGGQGLFLTQSEDSELGSEGRKQTVYTFYYMKYEFFKYYCSTCLIAFDKKKRKIHLIHETPQAQAISTTTGPKFPVADPGWSV